MSYVIPSRDISIEDKKLHRGKLIEALIQRASDLALGRREQLTVRDLLPTDLGLTDWGITLTGQTSYWIPSTNPSYSTPDMAIVGIYKFTCLSFKPLVSMLTLWKGASVIGKHNLESCYGGLPIIQNLATALMDPVARAVMDRLVGREESIHPELGGPLEGYFSEPYTFDPNSRLRIEVTGPEGRDYIVLGGFVVELAGMTVC